MRCGPLPPGKRSAISVHHQYSSRLSPFQAYTGTPVAAIAAAAWSCVEKMLQLAQRTSAPRATRVSINTAVWMVMCNEPVMRAPRRGFSSAYLRRSAINPGISCSDISISLRPNSARPISFTLYGRSLDNISVISFSSLEYACQKLWRVAGGNSGELLVVTLRRSW